jgi:hypothetical protein
MNLRLDDHAAMYITASGSRVHPPCIGLIQHFTERIPTETLEAHVLELISNPLGMGRRVIRPVIPGARSRWSPASEIPPGAMRVLPEPLDWHRLADLLDEEVSAQPDPLRNHGWRYTAVPTPDGGTVIINWTNHAYGDARSMLETVFAPKEVWSSAAPSWVGEGPPSTLDEIADVAQRIGAGVRGSLSLGREAAIARWRREHRGEQLTQLRPAVEALRSPKRQVGALSSRRVVTLARIVHDDWRGIAGEHGGSSNTLFLAVLANLIRGAREARGESTDRRLKILMPVDIGPFLGQLGVKIEGSTIISSFVELDGGGAVHGDIADVRAATKTAIETAVAAIPASPSSRPAGIVDAMHLLPNAITHRLATKVQSNVDGVASNVGPLPEQVGRLGTHTAADLYLVATPMRTDLTACFGRQGETSTLSFVADPARLGPAGTLSERVAAELDAWGISALIL